MLRKNILLVTIAGAVVLLDQLTKAWIMAALRVHEGFSVVDGLFNIVHVRNPGAAFGFLAGASPVFRSVFFIAVTAVALFVIAQYLRTARVEERSLVSALALIVGGAVGNLVDRVRFGEVVDFLDVYIGAHHWPAFNVADSAISVGAVLLAMILLGRRKDGAAGQGSGTAPRAPAER
ncbi:MAG: signal peptidase II [Syntrophales bacterium]